MYVHTMSLPCQKYMSHPKVRPCNALETAKNLKSYISGSVGFSQHDKLQYGLFAVGKRELKEANTKELYTGLEVKV